MVKIEFIAVVEDRRNEFKLRLGVDNSPNQYNNPMGYKLGLGLAERKGFEPSIPMQLEYTLSKRAPSTTRPPLYNLQVK